MQQSRASRRAARRASNKDPRRRQPAEPARAGGAASRRERNSSVRGWAAGFAIAAAVAFSPAIRAPFVYDDLPAIQQNETIRSLSPEVLDPPGQTAVAGRPVVNATLAINYAINDALGVDQRGDPDGPNKTIGYHVVNILLHLACGLLVFGVIRRTLAAGPSDDVARHAETLAGVTTLLWLVHPIQTEAVDYVIQRTELVVSVCYAGTLYCAIRAWASSTTAGRRCWYALAVLVCLTGMASKEVMITAPLAVALYDTAVRGTAWRQLWRDRGRRWLYASLVTTGLVVLFTIADGVRDRSVGFDLGVAWYRYLDTQAWAIARYLRLIGWPAGLTFDYGERPVALARAVPGLVFLGACGLATLVALSRRPWSRIGFLGAWFFLLLAPSSSVVPIKTEIAAERRIYLASAAVFVLVVVGAFHAARRFRARRRIGAALAGAAVVALTAVTVARSLTYRDQETLYRDVIAKAPDNPRGYVGVGLAELLRGPDWFDASAAMFSRATRVDSSSTLAWRSLGLVDVLRQDWRGAEQSYGRVLAIDSTDTQARQGEEFARQQMEKTAR